MVELVVQFWVNQSKQRMGSKKKNLARLGSL
jgi:hypothetical protein